MKILVIDNYDSFTFNLVQLIGKSKHSLHVVRNDEITLPDIRVIKPEKILISPGPGRPENSNLSLEVIKAFGSKIPILGVCLGMQAICYVFNGEIINAKKIFHGKISTIRHNNEGIFKNIPQNFEAMRYHSLIVKRKTLPAELEITASNEQEVVMGIRHKNYPINGIQFHPESILTPAGKQIINNWLDLSITQ